MARKKFVDPRHGPVTVVSKEELEKRKLPSEGVLTPKGLSVVVHDAYYRPDASGKTKSITITDTEVLDLIRQNSGKLKPREVSAMAGFRRMMTLGEELTERQQAFLYYLIEKCKLPSRPKTILSPEEKAERVKTKNALIALLDEKPTIEQVAFIFSEEVLRDARTALRFVLRNLQVGIKGAGIIPTDDVANTVLDYAVRHLGRSSTHSYLGTRYSKEPLHQLFYKVEVQEGAINEMRKNLSEFPAALAVALQDHPANMPLSQLMEILDSFYQAFILRGYDDITVSSVSALHGGSPGSSQGGRR